MHNVLFLAGIPIPCEDWEVKDCNKVPRQKTENDSGIYVMLRMLASYYKADGKTTVSSFDQNQLYCNKLLLTFLLKAEFQEDLEKLEKRLTRRI